MAQTPVVLIGVRDGYNVYGAKQVRYAVSGFTVDTVLNATWSPATGVALVDATTQYVQDSPNEDNYFGRASGDWVLYGETNVSTAEDKADFTSANISDPRGTYAGSGDSAGDVITILGIPPVVLTA
tara:strand:- start:1008 stop:1385 length:378 start_codon:yes stop_codon:yes gene_type:complete